MNQNGQAMVLDGDEEARVVEHDGDAVAALARSEVETQLAAAHRYPRSVKKFTQEAITLATLTREVAESCIYALPRADKTVAGPSVRLAEIIASAYGNLHAAARIVAVEDKEVVAQGVAWDLEKNVRITVETRRSIVNKYGKRYQQDMIVVTGNAAGSIALRNAIFRVVPRAYVDAIYAKVKSVAVGDAQTLVQRRSEVVARLQKIGVPLDRIAPRVNKAAIEDIGLDELEVLIGLGTAIKNEERTDDEAFPPPGGVPATAATPETKALESALTASAPAAAPAAEVKAEAKPKRGKGGVTDPQAVPVDRHPDTGEPVPPAREPGEEG